MIIYQAQLLSYKVTIRYIPASDQTQADKDKWSSLTMRVEKNGAMKTDFDYEDHTDDMVLYEKKWKEKYL